jgi:hypothetical protein
MKKFSKKQIHYFRLFMCALCLFLINIFFYVVGFIDSCFGIMIIVGDVFLLMVMIASLS